MFTAAENLKNFRNLISGCFVPVLKEDLDNALLKSEHFDEYRKCLEVQLPILFDLLQINQHWIFESNDPEAHGVYAELVVLLCEITSPSSIYRLGNESIHKNADRILNERTPIYNAAIEHIIFKFYQERLGKTTWKRQLGCLHGFTRFLQLQYCAQTLNEQWVNFCLSVGATVRESHELTCKHIGITIFKIILKSGKFEYIQEQNIHGVIYDSVLRDVDFLDTIEAAAAVWECLYKCLDFFKELDSFNWSHLDELMEKAIKNVTMASDNLISLYHLQIVTKLGSYFAINKQEIETLCKADNTYSTSLDKLRNICGMNNSYTIFRWAKSILNMFIVESYKLMQGSEISHKFLGEMHKCYLVCVTPIDLPVISPHLIAFLEKFITILMEVITAHKMNTEVIQLTKAFLETFKYQLQYSTYTQESGEFTKLYKAIEQLLKHKIFL
uniref:Uncharacterized protein n=1 Tax=Ceratitis capitata TaxID=7213 RepID=W8BBS8_CERCA